MKILYLLLHAFKHFLHSGFGIRQVSDIILFSEKYRDQIEIHIGFESEFFPGLLDEKKELSEKAEYMLLGQHHNDPYTIAVDYFSENSEEDILVYAEQVCAGLDSGLFTYLCHPDVIMMKQRHFTPACERAAHMIGAKCAETNTPVEIFSVHPGPTTTDLNGNMALPGFHDIETVGQKFAKLINDGQNHQGEFIELYPIVKED